MTESLKPRLHSTFIDRAPNPLTVDNLVFLFEKTDARDIEKCLAELTTEGILANKKMGKKTGYYLSNYEDIPTKSHMSIGSLKVPRMLANDMARSEDVNIFYESLAKKVAFIEESIEDKVNEKLKEYWGSIIILFGVFIGLFSLIVNFVQKVEIQPESSFWDILLLNSAQVIPISLVLLVFICVLHRLFR